MPIYVRGGTHETRIAPVEFRNAVGEWARYHGGAGGDIVWCAPIQCWQVRLNLKPGDPRRRDDRGDLHETVELHYWVNPNDAKWRSESDVIRRLRRHPRTNRPMPGFVAWDLDELGVTGVLHILQKGSLLTGAGEFKSAEQAGRVLAERHRDQRAQIRRYQRDETRHMAGRVRRQAFKIPFLPVEIELGGSRATSKEQTA